MFSDLLAKSSFFFLNPTRKGEQAVTFFSVYRLLTKTEIVRCVPNKRSTRSTKERDDNSNNELDAKLFEVQNKD